MVYDQSWSLKYAMEVTERSSGDAVTSTICLFCKFHGHQLDMDMEGRQRAATKGPQYHTSWSTDLFLKLITSQHADLWAAYQNEFFDGKKARFKGRIALSNTLYNWDLTGDVLEFSMSSETVEVVITELMFRPEDEMAALDNNMDEITIATVRATFNLDKLTGINDNMVGPFVRDLVGVTILKIGDLLATDNVWAMSFRFDSSNHSESTFFDLRVRLGVKGMLHNVHLIAMPHFDRHMANHQVVMLKKLLSAVYLSWADKLLTVSTDGEPTNMGRKSTTRHLDGC
ncbi:hypothetical protein DYB32_010936, partial [Aphanomyces invadans]